MIFLSRDYIFLSWDIWLEVAGPRVNYSWHKKYRKRYYIEDVLYWLDRLKFKMDFNIEETFEVFMAVVILTVAIVMVISASPPNYLHHHINEDPRLGRQMLYGARTAPYIFCWKRQKKICRAHTLFHCKFKFCRDFRLEAFGEIHFGPNCSKGTDFFWGRMCTISLYTLHITLNYICNDMQKWRICCKLPNVPVSC